MTYDELSERQAVTLLSSAPTQARRALQCELAGTARRQASRLVYSRDRVEALEMRPTVDTGALRSRGVEGLILIRVPPTVPVGTVRDPTALAQWTSGPWRPTLPLSLILQSAAQRGIPTIVTVSTWVVATYDTVGTIGGGESLTLELGEPGGWSAAADARQWHLGRGGRTFRYLHLGHFTRWFA